MKLSRPLCLASASPRRAELLSGFGLTFSVKPAHVDETPRPGEAPRALVRRLAKAKADSVAARVPGDLVLAADTVVVLGHELLGKPRDCAQAAAMLGRLSGRSHRVLSAYHLRDGVGGAVKARTVSTTVTFRTLSPAWIHWYARHPEGHDKAGAYGIQGFGGAMVESIAGSYTNVVGLPVEALLWDLLAQGWLELCP